MLKTILNHIVRPRDNLIDYIGAVSFGALAATDRVMWGFFWFIVFSILADVSQHLYNKRYPV